MENCSQEYTVKNDKVINKNNLIQKIEETREIDPTIESKNINRLLENSYCEDLGKYINIKVIRGYNPNYKKRTFFIVITIRLCGEDDVNYIDYEAIMNDDKTELDKLKLVLKKGYANKTRGLNQCLRLVDELIKNNKVEKFDTLGNFLDVNYEDKEALKIHAALSSYFHNNKELFASKKLNNYKQDSHIGCILDDVESIKIHNEKLLAIKVEIFRNIIRDIIKSTSKNELGKVKATLTVTGLMLSSNDSNRFNLSFTKGTQEKYFLFRNIVF